MLVTPETNSGPNIYVLSANLIMPPQLSILGTAEQYQEYAKAIGVDGFEINPVRSCFMYHAMRHATDLRKHNGEPGSYNERNATELDAIKSMTVTVHDTFRDEKVGRGFGSVTGKIAGYLSPHREQGIRRINALQYLAGRSLHSVFFSRYLNKAASLDPAQLPLMERSVQPKPYDWLGLWELPENASAAEARTVLLEYGFTSFTADGFHLQDGEDGFRFRRPLRLLRRMSAAGLVTAKHVSVNRLDCAAKGSKLAETTAAANEAFMHSPERAANTLEGRMLKAVVRDWKRLPVHDGQDRYVVLECPPLSPKQALSREEVLREQYEHQAIVHTIRELITAA